MRKLIIVLFIISAVALSCKKENPYKITNPESVVWNPVTKAYLISNAGSGYILALKNKKEFSVFNKTKLLSPKGMAVSGSNVYVTDFKQIVGYQLKDGKEIFRYVVPGALYLNDIAVSPDNLIYASDMKNNSIIMLNPVSKTVETFKHKDLNSPNGLYYARQDATAILYIVSFRADAPIQILNLKTRELKPVPNTEVSMADGITIDRDNAWLVSSWSDKTIHKFKPDFSARTKIKDSIQSPADIYYSTVNQELAIPSYETNTINFVTQIDTTRTGKK
jgi:sugar lactone lactonase YvrE